MSAKFMPPPPPNLSGVCDCKVNEKATKKTAISDIFLFAVMILFFIALGYVFVAMTPDKPDAQVTASNQCMKENTGKESEEKEDSNRKANFGPLGRYTGKVCFGWICP